MSIETIKTDAVILRGIKHSESSRILTVFTEAQGKISLIAKGIRKGKQRIPTDPFSLMRLVYRYKPARELQVVTQAEAVDAFLGIREDMGKMQTAFALCELTLRTMETADPHHDIFLSMVDTLKALNDTKGIPHNLLWHYELNLIRGIGFGLDFTRCAACGKEAGEGEKRIRFSFAAGGILCSKCRGEETSIIIHPESIKILRYIEGGGIERASRLKPSEAAEKEIDRLLIGFLSYHVEGMKGLNAADMFS